MNDIERSPRPAPAGGGGGMTDPLWLQLRNHPSLFCLHPTPKQLATMLECIASEVERRGDIDHDRDPGETAEWLRAEAKTAREVVYWDAARDAARDAVDAVRDAARDAARDAVDAVRDAARATAEVVLWHNGEGFDVHISSHGDQSFRLTWGEFKALKKVLKELDHD